MENRFSQGKAPKVKDEEGAFSFNHYVVSGLLEMREAKAKNELEKYFSIFEDTLQMLLPFINIEYRKLMQADYEKLEAYIEEMEAKVRTEGLHQETAQKAILKAKLKFVKNNRYYMSMAIPNAGVYRRDDEGVISFDEDSIPFEAQERIIRATSGGLPSHAKGAIEDANARNAEL